MSIPCLYCHLSSAPFLSCLYLVSSVISCLYLVSTVILCLYLVSPATLSPLSPHVYGLSLLPSCVYTFSFLCLYLVFPVILCLYLFSPVTLCLYVSSCAYTLSLLSSLYFVSPVILCLCLVSSVTLSPLSPQVYELFILSSCIDLHHVSEVSLCSLDYLSRVPLRPLSPCPVFSGLLSPSSSFVAVVAFTHYLSTERSNGTARNTKTKANVLHDPSPLSHRRRLSTHRDAAMLQSSSCNLSLRASGTNTFVSSAPLQTIPFVIIHTRADYTTSVIVGENDNKRDGIR